MSEAHSVARLKQLNLLHEGAIQVSDQIGKFLQLSMH
jgi:hypothetical protein